MTIVPAYIGEQINKHLTLASDFRAQRNSFFPAVRLAPESLSNIFILGARDHYHENENDGHLTFRVPTWVNVSYVCRRWRDVALNCPRLWVYHFTVSPRWTEELLTRSRRASLKIRVYFDPTRTSLEWLALLEKLLNHTERTQELRLRVPATVLPSKFSFHAPRLQILDVEGDGKLPPGWASMINNRSAPCLHTLTLNNFPLQWRSLNLSGITTLSLCHLPAPSQHDILDFLGTLNLMQGLEILHLDHALTSAREVLSKDLALDAVPKINLPCLTRLLVAAPISTVIVFLSRVNIPSKTKVRLEIGEDGPSVDDYARLPAALAERFSKSPDSSSFSLTIRSVAIRFPLPSFVLCASEDDDCDVDLSTDDPPPLDCPVSLVLLIEMEPWMLIRRKDMSIIGNICFAIPFTRSIQTLRVLHPPFDYEFWKQTLGHLRGLRHLVLSDSFMPDMASLLALPADEPGPTTGDAPLLPGPKFLPALEELTLDRMMFVYIAGILMDTITCQSLRDALATRNTPELRLTMIECDTEAEKWW